MGNRVLEPKLNLPALPAGRHYRFHAMNKPSGAECNIDCDYCFYLHKTDLLKHDEHARMGDSYLEQHIRQYIEAQTGEQVVFSWQGGEPTLMGLPFYERVVELQAKYAKPGQRIENDLQTNGIALDDDGINPSERDKNMQSSRRPFIAVLEVTVLDV